MAAAQAAAEPWLTLLDHVLYGQSWDSAAAPFRAAVPKADWESAVVQARGRFELVGVRKLISPTFTTSLPNAPAGQYVVLQYETQPAGDRTVVETITPMKESDGAWRVAGYFVRPR